MRIENDIFYNHKGHGLEPLNKIHQLRLERNDIFREVGSMRLIKRNNLTSNANPTIGHIVLDQKASIRIATKYDWKITELIMKEG